MRSIQLFLSALAMLVATSCAVSTEQDNPRVGEEITSEMVLESSPLEQAGSLPLVAVDDMLAMSPEMVAFLEANVRTSQNREELVRRLLHAVMRSGNFELKYDDSTRTAQDTFRAGRGNCLSFTNMFVAMSRHLGLDAHFQEVDIPPDWSMAGESFVLSQHVNVLLQIDSNDARVVDFNFYELETTYDARVVSDQRARAHYYNNIGAEHMLNGESDLSYANLRESILHDASFSPAWVNIGILHRREGFPYYAEAAYFQALEADPDSLMALSNLANLYEELEMPELALEYENRVVSHRMKNPYFRYGKANEAFLEGDYETAIQHLKYAIRKYRDDHRFYYLLSLSYLMSGDQQKAERWMKKAEDVASRSDDKERYNHKLELLRGMDNH